MDREELEFHYVCTRDEALKLVNKHKRFWVCNCGCRESRGECCRSRMDVCLMFRRDITPSGSDLKEISREEVMEIFKEAIDKHLVTRPFRNEKNKLETDGICFCCDDCCEYFHNTEEKCDKGDLIEKTDFEICNDCGLCSLVCYFNSRRIIDGRMVIERDNCYGCGLCVDECPEECIEMIHRDLDQWLQEHPKLAIDFY